ncbi:MAG: AAA family ATPase [Parcubacteria group bacterium]
MRIYVGGVNAVGKSTLLKEVAQKIAYAYVHATTGLLQHLGFDGDYEKLRELKQEERNVEYRKYVEKLLRSKNDFLLDAHYLGLVRGKVDRVTDSWLKNFDALILISAPFDDVWNRILADSKVRDRALFPSESSDAEKKDTLAKYQILMQNEFQRLANLYKKPYIEILNNENMMDTAVEELTSFITKIDSGRKTSN